MVNVNPVNTRPQSDTPEIRKYKKRFNSEILCAALWGEYGPRTPSTSALSGSNGAVSDLFCPPQVSICWSAPRAA